MNFSPHPRLTIMRPGRPRSQGGARIGLHICFLSWIVALQYRKGFSHG
jgi:hypothetical protein